MGAQGVSFSSTCARYADGAPRGRTPCSVDARRDHGRVRPRNDPAAGRTARGSAPRRGAFSNVAAPCAAGACRPQPGGGAAPPAAHASAGPGSVPGSMSAAVPGLAPSVAPPAASPAPVAPAPAAAAPQATAAPAPPAATVPVRRQRTDRRWARRPRHRRLAPRINRSQGSRPTPGALTWASHPRFPAPCPSRSCASRSRTVLPTPGPQPRTRSGETTSPWQRHC